MFVLTFLTISGVTKIVCRFRLFLEGITGKKMPKPSRFEFLERFLANYFALSDAEDNLCGPLNREGIYSRFTIVAKTFSNLPNLPRTKFLGSDGRFSFSSICKFGSFKNPFAKTTRLTELSFRFRRFILLVYKNKKSDFYELWQHNLNPLTKFTSSSRSTEFKDILPWNISEMITNTILINTRIVISYAMRQAIPLWVCWKVNGNWDNNMIRASQ